MSWWNLDSDQNESKREYLARVKFDEIVYKRAKSFQEIIDDKLDENVQIRVITDKSFNAIAVLEYLRKFYQVEEIYIAIYRMNEQSARKIIEYVQSDGMQANIIVSSFFRNNKNYEKWAKNLVSFASGNDKLRISFAWNHAKVLIAKTKSGEHIVFEGSGNLSDNARIEQYLIENNSETYQFHKQWMDNVLNQSINQ